jgi:nitroreductase
MDTFEQLARSRKTVKVLSHDSLPPVDRRAEVDRLLAAAGWAPFHKVCSSEHRGDESHGGIEPWRFHSLDAHACRRLRTRLVNRTDVGKIPAMLAAADAMVIANWLPNPLANGSNLADDNEAFDPTPANVEHIAAASAAVQSLLLAGTAAGMRTYWSSGGVLRTPEIFDLLGISKQERLLGAIFLFSSDVRASESIEIAESKLRPQRGPLASWSRWIEIHESTV